MDFAVVIPAYNEATTIGDVVRGCLVHTQQVIVVDDGSTDGTAERVRALGVTLLQHPHNQGKAASIWDGMCYAVEHGVEAVITLDGDGQHRPDDIPAFVQAADRYPHMIILGARHRGRQAAPVLRRFANRFADFWIAWAAGYPVRDSQCGFRLYPAALIRILRPHVRPADSFVFESEVIIQASHQGVFTAAVPIEALYPEQRRASHYRPLRDTVLITRMVALHLLRRGLYPLGLLRGLGWLRTKRH
jgi:glycosyltransferase involved in cell wall biosynthesis